MKVIFKIALLSCFLIVSFVTIFCDIKIFRQNKIYSEKSINGYKENTVLHPNMMKRDEVKRYALDFFNIEDESEVSEIHITVGSKNERGLWNVILTIDEENIYYLNIFADNKQCDYMDIYREGRGYLNYNSKPKFLESEKEKEAEDSNIKKIKAMVEKLNVNLNVDKAKIEVSIGNKKVKKFLLSDETGKYLFFIDEEYDEIFLFTDEESFIVY
ncbi:MAG: hypothetical protein ACRC41_11890 [Sarcina sp.]